MTAVEFLRSVRRRWVYVVVAVLLGAAAGVAVIVTATPQYRADATVYFSVPYATTANELAQGGNYAQQQLTSYAELATQPIVLKKVINRFNLDVTPTKLAGSVATTVSKDTVLVTISVTDPSPQHAADLANAIADQLGQTVRTLSPKSTNGMSAVDYAIAGEATPPQHAISPRKKIDLGGGLFAGLLVGIMAALIRDRADDRVWGEADLQDLPVLGKVPFDKGASSKGHSPLIADWATESARAEAFRQLRTSLQFADVDNPLQVVAVTSSVSAEGKSGVSANLAVAFAEAGHRVLLIDADLRRPSIATYFGLEGAVGLTNVLAGQVRLDEVIQEWGDRRLAVLPSGAVPPNPSEMVGSRRMSQLLDDLRSRYDVIVIDTPPLLPVTDASIIATRVDGTVLIARHGKTRRADLRRSIEALGSVDARIVGVALNRVPLKKNRGEYSYYGTITDSGLLAADEQLDTIVGDEQLVPADGPLQKRAQTQPRRRSAPDGDATIERSHRPNQSVETS